ncbi:hypothetical protein [Streptomyces sp. NPDC048473]|uniref:hypothetical protein n=1 Tax=unclassified Streptomyces TaxID=2593676 RepID=UPI003718236F
MADLRGAGLRWDARGHSTLSGPLLELAAELDDAFLSIASRWTAQQEEHPALLAAGDLEPVEYLKSFPHLASFAVCLSPEEDNLQEFVAAQPVGAAGVVRLARLAPAMEVLTPAACYHVYVHHRGEVLSAPRYVTTRNTCFRREAFYEPLRRQWSFRMREIVCIGVRDEVAEFLATVRATADRLMGELDLPIRWEAATDPFFNPAANPRYLAQRLQPTKHEAVYGDLALASVNLHEDHFGTAYAISRAERAATTGCIAFGIDRWLYALTNRWGTDPADWPDVRAAAERCGVL